MVKRTGPPVYPEFPKEEFEWRVQRARKIMQENNLDALMLTENVHVYYISGLQSVSVCRSGWIMPNPQPTVIITEDDVVLAMTGGLKLWEDTSQVETVEVIRSETDLADVLKRYGVGRGDRVGTELGAGMRNGLEAANLGFIRQRVWDQLSAQIVDGTAALWKMRAVKSKLEIDRMRKSVKAASKALEKCLNIVEPGMNYLDLARKAGIFMLEEGATMADNMQVYYPQYSGCMQLDREVDKEGYIGLDLSAEYKYYVCDLYRCALLGRQPTDDEKRLYGCRAGVNQVLQDTIKPGVSTDEVIDKMLEYVKECGCTVTAERAGHGIGLEVHERPTLSRAAALPEFQDEDGQFILEEGMMFTLEPPIRLPGLWDGQFGFNVEDNAVITATGCEVMSSMLSQDLVVRL